MESNDALAPEQALKDIQTTRQLTAERTRAPWWYYFALGLASAVFILSFGFTTKSQIATFLLVIAFTSALGYFRKQATGASLEPLGHPSTQRRTWLFLLTTSLIGAAGVLANERYQLPYALPVAAALALLISYPFGQWIEARYRQHILQGGQR